MTAQNVAAATPASNVPGRGFWLAFAVLLGAIAFTALGVVNATHTGRYRLNTLQQLEQKRNAIQVEYGRLLLEQSSLVAQGKVEDMAVSELGMETPDMSKVVVLGGQ
ncbi:MAG TPA: cell division protein FtsL [Hyphomicrobiales bacterium]|nr:cell division protein FtsL [Hyphomicrobiales bacterium]